MKASEISNLGIDELNKQIADLKKTLFTLRFQNEVGQLENPKKILHVRRDIARLKTILTNKF